MKKFFTLLLSLCVSYFAQAQVVINEWNQNTGNGEWVELLVTGSAGCNTTNDLRGIILDDNNGRFSSGGGAGTGIAAGAFRFRTGTTAFALNWAAVPTGSLILIYEPTPAGGFPADDPTDANCDGVYVLGIGDASYWESQITAPGTTGTCSPPPAYPSVCAQYPALAAAAWVVGGNTNCAVMANGGDSFQVLAAGTTDNNVTLPLFSVSWGNNTTNNGTATTAIFGSNNSGFANANPSTGQTNWTFAAGASGAGTPGMPNTCANHKFINDLRRVGQSATTATAETNTEINCAAVLGSCAAFKLNSLALAVNAASSLTVCSGEKATFDQTLVTQEPQFCSTILNVWNYVITESWTAVAPVATGGLSAAVPTQLSVSAPCTATQTDTRVWETPTLTNATCADQTVVYTRTVTATLTNGISTLIVNNPDGTCAQLQQTITVTVRPAPQAPTPSTAGCVTTFAPCGAAQTASPISYTANPGDAASSVNVTITSGTGGTAAPCTQVFSVAVPACAGAPLSIALTNFTAALQTNTVALAWQTISENKNNFFDIEHSSDGKNFTTVGTVRGAGTTTTIQNYSFAHTAPARGVNYYRLRQTDFDGQTTFSDVRAVRVSKGNLASLRPTEASEILVVSLHEVQNANTTLDVFDALGRQMAQLDLEAGASEATLQVGGFAAGQYIVRIGTGSETTVLRFVKSGQ